MRVETENVKKSEGNKDNVIPFDEFKQKAENYRIFEVNRKGKVFKLRLRQPTAEEIDWADWEYSKVFNDAISEGIRPRSALIDMLIDNGIDINEMQEEVNRLNDELQKNRQEFMKAKEKKDIEEMKRIREEIIDIRDRWQRKNAIIRDYLRQSAESKAEDAREHFLLATVLEYAEGPHSGEHYYISRISDGRRAAKERFKKFNDDDDQAFKLKIILEFITYINGLAIDDLNTFPEDDMSIENNSESFEENINEVKQVEEKKEIPTEKKTEVENVEVEKKVVELE